MPTTNTNTTTPPLLMSQQAAVLNACIDGDDSTNSDRNDWILAVQQSCTLARLAALTQAFIHQAMERLVLLESGYDALSAALKKKPTTSTVTNNTEPLYWTLCTHHLDETVIKLDDTTFDQLRWVRFQHSSPYWCPAFIVTPTDTKIVKQLQSSNHSLVCRLLYESFDLVDNHSIEPYSHDQPTSSTTALSTTNIFTETFNQKLQMSISFAKQLTTGSNSNTSTY